MHRFLAALLFLCLFAHHLVSQQKYYTHPLVENIKTVQVCRNGDSFLPPVISLHSSDAVVLKFDNLHIDETRLRYKLTHCDAHWNPSVLSEIEYLNGFNDQLFENFRFSENTSVPYIHYAIEFPNTRLQMKLSGNYAVEVYTEDNPEKILLQACFSVVDPLVDIRGEVSGNTDIDIHKAHQQLRFEVLLKTLALQNANDEIQVTIRQNNRVDNERAAIKPTFIFPEKLVFEHQKEFIFEGGNEYRRFETVNKESNGLNVQKTYHNRPYFNAVLLTDESRSDPTKPYDKDQNGRFFIRNSNALDSDIEADYFMTHFTFNNTQGLSQVLLSGDFTYSNPIVGESKENPLIRFCVLLKQGMYNYQYVTSDGNKLTTQFTEGNYFNTENEYSIMVYHRLPGSRYDKLVGYTILRPQ